MLSKTLIAMLLSVSLAAPAFAAEPAIPNEFKDPETGARMLRLSRMETPVPCSVIYFTQPCITQDSRYVLVRQQDMVAGHTAGILYRFDLQTQEFIKLTDRMTRYQWMDPPTGDIYYSSDKENAIYVTNVMSKETKKFADMPKEMLVYAGLTVNKDHTKVLGIAGLHAEQDKVPALTAAPNQGGNMAATFARHETQILFSFDIKDAKFTELHRINTWLGHVQYSVADANLLMFCHEGPWDLVDRMWTLDTSKPGNEPKIVYKPQKGEIVGHEFFSTDGQTIWFDDQFRDGTAKRYLASKNVVRGELNKIPQVASNFSLHYTQSWDGKYFIGDGTAANKGMYLLTPVIDKADPSKNKLVSVKLCDMSKNDYAAAEPNPHLTPDQHWAVFTATLHGMPQAYAIEMPKEYWLK